MQVPALLSSLTLLQHLDLNHNDLTGVLAGPLTFMLV